MKYLLVLLILMMSVEGKSQNLPLSAGSGYPLSGALYHSGNSYIRRSLSPTYFGYSTTYRVLMLGSASPSYTTQEEGSVTLSVNYDPSGNPSGNFAGDGREVLFRNGVAFITPNVSNDGYHLNNLVLKDGKVGIGTPTTSAARLQVVGGQLLETSGTNSATRTLTIMQEGGQQANYGAYLGQWRSALQIQGNDNQYLLHIVPPEVDYGYSVFRSTNAGIKFATGGSIANNGNDALTITHDGSVGINTSNPSEKLSVNGNIRSKKVIVSQTGWPDYVFESSYTLKPLHELESFIAKHKHLPDIPSAKEVAEKGISVGDQQALLLKKIEELTLYIIQQEARIKALEKKQKK